MKASALRGWLSSHIEIMEKACGAQSASGLRRMSEVLAIRPDATVTEVCKVLNKVEQCGDGGLKIGPLADLFRSMAEAACMFAKAADAIDLKRFAATIESKRNEPIDAFVSRASVALAPRPTPAAPAGLGEGDLRAYLQRLEEALGDERNFDVVYHQLSKDVRLKVPEAKKLAKSFVGKSGRSKADALGLIYGRHKSLMSARPKAAATGGRLAG